MVRMLERTGGGSPLAARPAAFDGVEAKGLELVQRFHASRHAIHEAVEKGGPAAYAVSSDGVRQTWP